jgi:PhzF family phenazine biosynthesis protein
MELPIYQVDAFANRVFTGNPAAICPLPQWLPDSTMQSIAMENNLAETAFFVKTPAGYHLRWFTPVNEMDLCGHATLASAYVIFRFLEPELNLVRFETRSGTLTVSRQDALLTLDFPARPPEQVTPCAGLLEALGGPPREVWASRDYMIVYGSEAEILALQPNMPGLLHLDRFAVSVTAPASTPGVDFVSRFFAPAAGVPEDPVTGSAHCTLVPYWAQRLGQTKLTARQVSPRGGELLCELKADRVTMAGEGVLFLRGTIEL